MREYLIWLAKLVTLVFFIFVVIPIVLGGVIVASQDAIAPEIAAKKNVVAVVELTGMIDDTKEVVKELYKQADNEKIEGIVLRVDSPGGAVAPSQDVYRAVMDIKKRKPIVASMGTLAASGGFYASIGASKVIAEPGTMTGSIGVVLQIPNFTKIMNTVGVDVVTIKSGKLKDAGNTFRPMTDEERTYLETTAHTVHEQFIKDIAVARNIPSEKVHEFADGRVLMGEDAQKLGLVDGFGTVYDAARVVFDVKGSPLPEGTMPELFYPETPFKEFKKYLGAVASIPKLFMKSAELRYQLP